MEKAHSDARDSSCLAAVLAITVSSGLIEDRVRRCLLVRERLDRCCQSEKTQGFAWVAGGTRYPMVESSAVLLLGIGLAAGVLSGVFGIGGGVVIVPALIYLAGFTQHRATGTSLAVLLPPIGFAAMWEYYRHDNVNVRAAMIIAAAVFVGGWLGALVANRVSGPYLRLAFGVFVVVLGLSLIAGAFRRLGWI